MDNREVIGEVRTKDKNVVAQWHGITKDVVDKCGWVEVRTKDKNVVAQWHGITKDVVDKCGWVVTNPSKSRDKL